MSNNSPTENNKVLDFIKASSKEIIIGLITTLLGGSVISYVISRIFIKSYMTTIGFNTLEYSALTNYETAALLTLAIFTVLLAIIFIFSFVPMYLRFTYNDTKPLFEEIHNKYSKYIDWFFFFCFLLPLGILILVFLEKSFEYYVLTGLSSGLIFLFILFKSWNSTKAEDKFKIIYNGFLFSMLTLLAFTPFLKVIETIDSLNVESWIFYLIVSIVWVLLSASYGFRITKAQPIHYLIDIAVSILVLLGVIIMSTNTIKIPIANFVGIKDDKAHIYKISSDDFIDIENNIKAFWDDSYSSKQPPNNQSKNTEGYYLASAINSLNEDIYLYAKVIFRDGEHAILCPPQYKVGKDEYNETCFITKSAYLIPTPLTMPTLDRNPKIKDKLWIPLKKNSGI
ncbi:hypothetical protein [uncultured Psychrobacter sp.]|uniref:hypothetical protein n=1 Tax=uncultured Psychrobacter sp. TaxID=259303 RepID=UPI0026376248|nr:hypothetical protein [uncultured Psychrobacter sp.]